jgi:chromosome segregation ATPase
MKRQYELWRAAHAESVKAIQHECERTLDDQKRSHDRTDEELLAAKMAWKELESRCKTLERGAEEQSQLLAQRDQTVSWLQAERAKDEEEITRLRRTIEVEVRELTLKLDDTKFHELRLTRELENDRARFDLERTRLKEQVTRLEDSANRSFQRPASPEATFRPIRNDPGSPKVTSALKDIEYASVVRENDELRRLIEASRNEAEKR